MTLRVAPEVADALARRAPVVCLETTLIAHGFPAGEGYAVGASSEAAVRAAGAVPATVGILDGELIVGLTDAELQRFGDRALRARRARAISRPAACRVRSGPRPSAARSPRCARSASR